MRIEKAFAVMRQTPLRHNRPAARNDAGQALRRHRHIAQQHAGVNGEVIDTLLRLLQQRIAKHLPVKVFRNAADLFQRLVNRYGADRHRAVAQDPLASFMNIATGGEIHHGIGAPARRPDQFLHLFFDRGGDGRVADVGVDLDQKVAADNHRFRFGMVDIRGNDGAPGGHFLAHELRRDVFRQLRAETLAVMLLAQHFAANAFASHILAQRDKLHLRRDDALTCIVELGHPPSRFCAPRLRQPVETQMIEPVVGQTLLRIA